MIIINRKISNEPIAIMSNLQQIKLSNIAKRNIEKEKLHNISLY